MACSDSLFKNDVASSAGRAWCVQYAEIKPSRDAKSSKHFWGGGGGVGGFEARGEEGCGDGEIKECFGCRIRGFCEVKF
jgi:hypothetical protein